MMTFENIVIFLLAELSVIAIILIVMVMRLYKKYKTIMEISRSIADFMDVIAENGGTVGYKLAQLVNKADKQSNIIIKLVDIQEWHNKILSDKQKEIIELCEDLQEVLGEVKDKTVD